MLNDDASGTESSADASVSDSTRGALASIAEAALGFFSLEDTLSDLLERIRTALEVDTAALLLLDEERGVLVARAANGLEEEVRQGVQIPLSRGFAGRVAAEGRPIVIDDMDHADVVNPILRQKGVRSMVGVPVQVEGRVIGVMHVGSLHLREFQEGEVAVLQLAADRAADVIDRVLIAEQRSVTASMQRTLLPGALPQIPGLKLSAKYLPAGAGIKIGGDWYDVFQLPNGRMAFVIGDVVGRGVLAASVMLEIRTVLRAYMVQGHKLADVVAMLNELLVSMERDRAATLSIIEIDPDGGELLAVTAGHLPPLLISPDGEVRLLEEGQGLPVGVRSGYEYQTLRYPFPIGSRLLLYTDGLIERRDESIDVGFERLISAARMAAESATGDLTFADRVYDELLVGATLEDDVAVLAIETVALGTVLEMTLRARPTVLAGMRNALGRWLRAAGANERDLFDITLSASEAATNAIEHAYGARDAIFTVRCERVGDQVTVTVRDTGRWRMHSPAGGGRGLEIMRALLDTVKVNSGMDGTIVTMTKNLAGPDEPA